MAPPLDKLSSELRSAVLAGDHVLAGRLATGYARALQELWESLPESDRAASPIPQQASELLTWAHGMTLIQRAMAGAQLAVIEKAIRYNVVCSPESPSPNVQLRG